LYILEGYEILIIILKSRLKLNIIAGIFFIGVDIIDTDEDGVSDGLEYNNDSIFLIFQYIE
jgi:hypothetical protein